MVILIIVREEEMACCVGTMKIARVNSEKIVEKYTSQYVKPNDYGDCRDYNCKLLHQKLYRQFFLLEYFIFLYLYQFLGIFSRWLWVAAYASALGGIRTQTGNIPSPSPMLYHYTKDKCLYTHTLKRWRRDSASSSNMSIQ